MSEEEIIKEIEIIKETQDIVQHNLDIYPPKEDIYKLDTKQFKAVICLLDLYYKQQQQIEEYKKDKRDNMSVVYGGRRFGTEGMVVKDYISKDKIIKALGYQKDDEEYETMNEEKILSLISTLMSEVDRLENLEDDLTSAYISGFYDGEKKVKDKIREKIKELDNIAKAECIERAEEDIKLLKELLGEEDVTKI